jgi:hypothetical protein
MSNHVLFKACFALRLSCCSACELAVDVATLVSAHAVTLLTYCARASSMQCQYRHTAKLQPILTMRIVQQRRSPSNEHVIYVKTKLLQK